MSSTHHSRPSDPLSVDDFVWSTILPYLQIRPIRSTRSVKNIISVTSNYQERVRTRTDTDTPFGAPHAMPCYAMSGPCEATTMPAMWLFSEGVGKLARVPSPNPTSRSLQAGW